MGHYLKIILFTSLFAAGLCSTNLSAQVATGTGVGTDLSSLDGIDSVPEEDLWGWFLTFDPSQQWTSAANIATMESWLAAVEDTGGDTGDPSVLAQVEGLGTNDSLTLDSTAPEPATLELLAGALAILFIPCLAIKG